MNRDREEGRKRMNRDRGGEEEDEQRQGGGRGGWERRALGIVGKTREREELETRTVQSLSVNSA